MMTTIASQDGHVSPELPEMPHELPLDRGLVDALVDRARQGENIDLLEGLLDAVDWSGFHGDDADQFALYTYKSAMPTIDGTALFRGETAILTGADSSGRAA